MYPVDLLLVRTETTCTSCLRCGDAGQAKNAEEVKKNAPLRSYRHVGEQSALFFIVQQQRRLGRVPAVVPAGSCYIFIMDRWMVRI